MTGKEDPIRFDEHGLSRLLRVAPAPWKPEDSILVVVNLNPFHWEEGMVHLDMEALGLEPGQTFEVHDLFGDTRYVWNGPNNYVRLDPQVEPAHVFLIGS